MKIAAALIGNWSVGCITTLVYILSSPTGYGQATIKEYIKKSAVMISGIEPDSIDYSDLESIGSAIGDARVVMLGEQDHGDAPTFLAKTRLIKYLHEKKGFNVLAFEHDFFTLNYGWEKVGKSEVAAFLSNSISALWTYCISCQQLFKDYIPSQFENNSLLEVTGFDNTMTNGSIIDPLDSVIRSAEIPLASTNEYVNTILPRLRASYNNMEDSNRSKAYKNDLLLIRKELAKKFSADNFWVRVVDNLISSYTGFAEKELDYFRKGNLRDSQMAKNLEWLAKVKYPDQRIIVWAHNHHVSKYSGHYPVDYFNEARTMGTFFTEIAGNMDKTYIVGFSSYEGTAGRLFPKTRYKVPKPETNSFENWIPRDYQYAFVDFAQFNKLNPGWNQFFNMSGGVVNSQYHKNYKALWNRVFDGVFFIRKMYPCKSIEASQ